MFAIDVDKIKKTSSKNLYRPFSPSLIVKYCKESVFNQGVRLYFWQGFVL